MNDFSLIPSVWASGRFEATAPFDKVVDPKIFYTVEAVRTIDEMQADGEDLYPLVFKPIGVSIDEYNTVLERSKELDGVIICLTCPGIPRVYVLSTYLKAFPMVDGVCFERLCAIVDLGSCSPKLKDVVNATLDHFRNYAAANIGVDAKVSLGYIPSRSYVSKDQADVFEQTRLNKITGAVNDVSYIKQLETKVAQQQAYITLLECKIK